MQKVVATLEKNVEWIALGLAGLWVLWIVWAYVISKPVVAEINGEQYSAASVDTVVKNEAAERLAAKVKDSGAAMEISVPQVAMDWSVPVPPPLAVPPIESVALQPDRLQNQLQPDANNPNAIRASGDKVAQLPTIPAPRLVEAVSDKGQVIPPVIQQNPNVVGPDGIAAQPLLPPQPLQPQGGAFDGMAANPQLANAKDAWWVWVTAKFDEGAVQKAFQEAGIPPHLSRMEYLAVEVQREELLPNGKWGNAKLIPPLKMNAPPPEFDRKRAPMEYLQWALQQQNQYVILEPPFFQTVGTRKIPLHLQPKVQTVAETMVNQFQSMQDLAMQLEGGSILPTQERLIMNQLTPEQKQELLRERSAIQRERQQQEAQRRRQEQQQRDAARRSQRSSRTGSYAPIDSELMGEMLASGGGSGGGFYRDPRMGGYGARGSGSIPPMPPPLINPVNPMVDPTQMNVVRPGGIAHPDGRGTFGEFDLWAYDDTVEQGKTYRYRLRVVMKNPVYKIGNAVADPKLAQVMELPVDPNAGWSEWTRPIVVDRGVDMFLAGAGRNAESVRFDIYRWQDGRVNKQAFTATPGDVVGSVDTRTKVDFNTGYAVVDIRQIANRDYRVTLIDQNGTQVVRTYQEDQNDPKRQQLENEANKPANPALTELR